MSQREPFHCRYLNGVPIARGKVVGALGTMEEANRRAIAEGANERFLAALSKVREEEYRLADKIDAEIHKPPNEQELTAFERAMARVKAGANIVEIKPIRKPDPPFTLGGVSGI